MKDNNIIIRKAAETDSDQLWSLMQRLAVFEKYIGSFAITPEIVRESGFKKSPPDFHCFVADAGGKLAGMLVYYFLPYTAQNRAAIYMKELFVDENFRGQKLGEQLMNALKEEAVAYNCKQIKWGVAPWNQGGLKFYQRLGATENPDWLNYEWNL